MQVFLLGCLPCIVCDRCSGTGLWWHCHGALVGDRAWHPIHLSSVPLTYAGTHVLYIVFLTQSAHTRFALTFFAHMRPPPSYYKTSLPVGCWIRLMMLLYAHESERIWLNWNLYILVNHFRLILEKSGELRQMPWHLLQRVSFVPETGKLAIQGFL